MKALSSTGNDKRAKSYFVRTRHTVQKEQAYRQQCFQQAAISQFQFHVRVSVHDAPTTALYCTYGVTTRSSVDYKRTTDHINIVEYRIGNPSTSKGISSK